MVIRPLDIPVYTQPARPVGEVAHPHIPKLHRVAKRDKNRLFGGNAAVGALITAVRQAMPAGIFGFVERLAHRLPGHRPVIPGVVVPQIDIVPGPVQRHTVRSEPRHPVILRRTVKRIAARRLVENGAVVVYADIICPGNRCIHPLHHIFPPLIVKSAILHASAPFLSHLHERLVPMHMCKTSLNALLRLI